MDSMERYLTNSTEESVISANYSSLERDLVLLSDGETKVNKRRGKYNAYTVEERLEIVKYSLQFGSTGAARKFSKKDRKLSERTVREWKKKYEL